MKKMAIVVMIILMITTSEGSKWTKFRDKVLGSVGLKKDVNVIYHE